MSKKIYGVTVGTPMSPATIAEKLKPVKTVNGVAPDENGNVNVEGGGGGGGIAVETDPTVPAWAKQPKKPTYTASEVGALPASTVIPTVPTKVSAFQNDAGYLTQHQDLSGYTKKSDVDSTLSATSTNPIQNKAVAQKFSSLEADVDRIEGAIPTDTYINTLIDAKLGVIENGTY